MVGHKVVAVMTSFALFASPLLANAQCKADVDCKGDRICENEQCVDPRTRKPDAPPPPAVPPPPVTKEDDGVTVTISDTGAPAYQEDTTGWAMAAGIIGLAGAAGVLSLSVGSAVTSEDEIPSIPLGVAATVLVAALGPIVFVGGGSARRSAGATGLLGLRIGGWIAYGVSLLGAAYLLLFSASGIAEPPGWLIVTDGVFGALSLAMFGTDALVAHGEASEGAISDVPFMLPTLVMARESSGTAVPGLGVAARF